MARVQDYDRRASGQQNIQEKPTLADNPYNPNSAAYLVYPVKHVVSSLYRRMTEPPDNPVSRLLDAPSVPTQSESEVYTPPQRTESPFQPPPLTPLELIHSSPNPDLLILTRSLAEEIRLLVPSRLQLVNNWRLAFSIETDGSALSTLYSCCADMAARSQRAGWVLVVRDNSVSSRKGSVFGAYLTDAPKPGAHYYGSGECFLWRASILPTLQRLQFAMDANHVPPSEAELSLAGLPPPPSADTTNMLRATTVRAERRSVSKSSTHSPSVKKELLAPPLTQGSVSGTSTPDRIRFKAFPYSGLNDFTIFCEPHYLSIGGGDGHYGLWLDDTLDRGISQQCPTFGNEPLTDEDGGKFEVLGVEVWYVGA